MTVYSKPVFDCVVSSSLQMMIVVNELLSKKTRRETLRGKKRKGTRTGCPTMKRERKTISQIYREISDTMFRRSYRMSFNTFLILYNTIKTHLIAAMSNPSDKANAPNGRIPLSSRLGMAIRVYAGGDPCDIHQLYGVSYREVFYSVDYVTDAINQCPLLAISFPTNHTSQQELAKDFQTVSKAGFSGCCGCLDGILIWMHRPSAKECEDIRVGCSQFFCARKNKYGVNLQALCDRHLRFLDISVLFGGCTSDTLAFELSDMKRRLDTPGFLSPGLYIFGDNAYINTHYLATPFANVNSSEHKTKDSYNYFHSNVRIKVECAFGLLTQRWGILRKPMPRKYTVKKTVSTLSCLCRLHNFLINQRLQDESYDDTANNSNNAVPPPITREDNIHMYMEGAVPMEEVQDTTHLYAPQLADVGHHTDDHNRTNMVRRAAAEAAAAGISSLPRDYLHQQVTEQHLCRPSMTGT